MNSFLRFGLLAAAILVAAAAPLAAQEAPRLHITVGTTAVNPGDVVTLPDTAVGDTSEPLVVTIANEGDGVLDLSPAAPAGTPLARIRFAGQPSGPPRAPIIVGESSRVRVAWCLHSIRSVPAPTPVPARLKR